MLKGVNKQVVEIIEPESAYFEKALFFVKPEFCAIGENKLRATADALLKNASNPPSKKNQPSKKYYLLNALKMVLCALAGAAVSAAAFLFS